MIKLYIDPGTGSMLFAILIGVIGAAGFVIRNAIAKIRFMLTGGKGKREEMKKAPLVIFSDDKRYWKNFEPICRELDKRGFDVKYMTASEDDPVLDNLYAHVQAEFVGAGNKAFYKLNFLNANIVFATTPGLDVYQWKRSKGVDYYVHIAHAPNDITLYRMFGIDYYDAILLSGDYQIEQVRKLEKLRNLPEKELVKVGLPYMDDMAKRLSDDTVEKSETKTVLLAPSWGKSAIFARFGEKIISELLKTDYHIIVRPHPQSVSSEKEMLDKLMAKFPDSDRLEWNYDTDNYEVLKKSDVNPSSTPSPRWTGLSMTTGGSARCCGRSRLCRRSARSSLRTTLTTLQRSSTTASTIRSFPKTVRSPATKPGRTAAKARSLSPII